MSCTGHKNKESIQFKLIQSDLLRLVHIYTISCLLTEEGLTCLPVEEWYTLRMIFVQAAEMKKRKSPVSVLSTLRRKNLGYHAFLCMADVLTAAGPILRL